MTHRWLTYLECICSSAEQICEKYFQIVLSGMSLFCLLKNLIILPKSPASASSRTIFNSLFSINEAKYCITLSWLSFLRRSISRMQSFVIIQEDGLSSVTWRWSRPVVVNLNRSCAWLRIHHMKKLNFFESNVASVAFGDCFVNFGKLSFSYLLPDDKVRQWVVSWVQLY